MTQTLELSDGELDVLLTVLERNEGAIEAKDGIRWTNQSAAEIGVLKREIEDQRQ